MLLGDVIVKLLVFILNRVNYAIQYVSSVPDALTRVVV